VKVVEEALVSTMISIRLVMPNKEIMERS